MVPRGAGAVSMLAHPASVIATPRAPIACATVEACRNPPDGESRRSREVPRELTRFGIGEHPADEQFEGCELLCGEAAQQPVEDARQSERNLPAEASAFAGQ